MGILAVIGLAVVVIWILRTLWPTGQQVDPLSCRIPCPFCQEAIHRTAVLCPFCRADLTRQDARRIIRMVVSRLEREHERRLANQRAANWIGIILLVFAAAFIIYKFTRL